MSFNSAVSKNQAHATVSKLFANILPEGSSKKSTSSSSTQLLSSQFNQQTSKVQRKLESKRQKKVALIKMKKVKELNKKFSKNVKYNIIKNHAEHSIEEAKYLTRLQKKNVNQILRLGEIDDMVVGEEMEEIKRDLVGHIVGNKVKRVNKDHAFMEKLVDDRFGRNNRDKLDAFNRRVEDGVLAVPGLTPGLAPVDYNESEEE